MKQLVTLVVTLFSLFSSIGQQSVTPPPVRIERGEGKGSPTDDPLAPSDYHLYAYFIEDAITVYSMEPICGEIIAHDALTGESLCYVYTDLGASFTFNIGEAQIISLRIIVDGINYTCEIAIK